MDNIMVACFLTHSALSLSIGLYRIASHRIVLSRCLKKRPTFDLL